MLRRALAGASCLMSKLTRNPKARTLLGVLFLHKQHKKISGRYFTFACASAQPLQRGVLRQLKFHKEQVGRFPD
jgi:hypothetical protein